MHKQVVEMQRKSAGVAMSEWWRSQQSSEGLTRGNTNLPPTPPVASGRVMPPPPPPLLRDSKHPQRKRRGWLIVAAATGTLLLFLGVVLVDQIVRVRELATLTTKIETSETTMENFISQVKKVYGDIDPSSKGMSELDLETYRIADVAGRSLTELSVERAEIEGVSILPWHSGISELQDKYLAHSSAWENLLAAEASASQWQDLIDAESRGVNIGPTFAVAKAAFPAAIPALFGDPLRMRLTEIFRN